MLSGPSRTADRPLRTGRQCYRKTSCAGGSAVGATLIELLATVAIVGVLAATARPRVQGWLDEQRVALAAELLSASIRTASAAAAAYRQPVQLVPLGRTTGSPPRGPGANPAIALDADTPYDAGWRMQRGSDTDAVILQTVRTPGDCLQVRLHTSAGAGQALRLAPVGYSRSRHGGFVAARFELRCGAASRQVRLGALGGIRICRPRRDPDCDGAAGASDRDGDFAREPAR